MSKRNWSKLLKKAPTQSCQGDLYRFVSKKALDGGVPPDYLFASGARNRCNPAGVRCLYLAEDTDTALLEFKKYFSDTPPSVLYRVVLEAAAIIDLTNKDTLDYFQLTDEDLYGSFRLKRTETPLEALGAALSKQTTITAIRFPSAACFKQGQVGNNLVVFKDALIAPDFLEVFDPDNTKPDRWP